MTTYITKKSPITGNITSVLYPFPENIPNSNLLFVDPNDIHKFIKTGITTVDIILYGELIQSTMDKLNLKNEDKNK